ncbi:MAG TPA: cation:proton antiporter, partial [bacterium]|nr:cation:proton antiporter [bacterium]
MSIFDLDILALLGIGAFGGILGARLFQLLRIPQVVGYIAIGVLIGKSGIGLINDDSIATLGTFNLFALGLIGFLVGGELHGATFRKYGRQFSAILVGEGMGAFLLVGIPVTLLCWHFLGNLPLAVASGIVFGSISSATDPASTIDVLWEYRSRGILTTSLVAIVALDDALAMTLYGFGTSIASILTGGEVSLQAVAGRIAVELFGAIALGVGMGFFLNPLLRWLRRKEQTLVLALAILLLVIGISSVSGMDIILATMALGVTLTNLAPRRSEELFSLIQMLSKPIYVIFFVLVGARLGIGEMPGWFWLVIAVYVVARSLGKLYGARLGGYVSQAPPTVTRYCGYGLFAQGGVAVGLSIMAAHHLGEIPAGEGLSLGDMIISAVTATTLIVQVIGPSMVKFAIRAA